MKKIVILSDNSGRSFRWITLLKALFPECKIEIQWILPDEEILKSYLLGSLSEKSIIG